MSVEALWYSSFTEDGSAPHCIRYSRMPMDQQLDLTIHLAIAFAGGRAGYRQVVNSRGETYWYWPRPVEFARASQARNYTGWWMIPHRIDRRARLLVDRATHQACRRGSATNAQIAAVLRSWKRTGAWRKYAASIYPRHGEPNKPPSKRQISHQAKLSDAKQAKAMKFVRAARSANWSDEYAERLTRHPFRSLIEPSITEDVRALADEAERIGWPDADDDPLDQHPFRDRLIAELRRRSWLM